MEDNQDYIWMRQALELAHFANSTHEVPVGAILVQDNQIIGRGWNQSITGNDPSAHAEIQALRDAGKQLDNYRFPGSTLYTTLEPCPMCAGAIVQARVSKVVYGADDPKSGACGSVFQLLPSDTRFNHRTDCIGGILATESSNLLKQFFQVRRSKAQPVNLGFPTMNRATKNKQQFQALLLDVDGTMAETERDGHRVAFNRAFADFDLDWCWSEDIYGQLLTVAGGKERIQYFIDTYHPALPQIPNIQEFIIELHQHKTAIYNQILHDSTIPLRPGIARLLQEAKEQGIMLGIVTTTSRTNVESLINTTLGPQALNWFAVIGAGNQVTAKKPAPDIYQYAMQQLGLPPQSCIAIEDSAIGLNSALSAGIPTVIVTVTDYTREQNLTGATLVVENLGDSEHPCQVLAGAINSINLVDIPLLKSLHETPQ